MESKYFSYMIVKSSFWELSFSKSDYSEEFGKFFFGKGEKEPGRFF